MTVQTNAINTPPPALVSDGGTNATTVLDANGQLKVPISIAKNMVIGGDFSTNPWQRNNQNAVVTSGQSCADMWTWYQQGHATASVKLSRDISGFPPGDLFFSLKDYSSFVYMKYQLLTRDPSIASDVAYFFNQFVEGFRWKLFAQVPLTLSFWVKAAPVGVYCVSLENPGPAGTGKRNFIAEYTINTANTWEKKVINIPASPADGTWNYGEGVGINLNFCLGAGIDWWRTSPGSWANVGGVATPSQTSWASTTGAVFYIDLIQIERGNVATNFEYRMPAYELFLCQRFYEKSFRAATEDFNSDFCPSPGGQNIVTANAVGGGTATLTGDAGAAFVYIPFEVTKAVIPSMNFWAANTSLTLNLASGKLTYYPGDGGAPSDVDTVPTYPDSVLTPTIAPHSQNGVFTLGNLTPATYVLGHFEAIA